MSATEQVDQVLELRRLRMENDRMNNQIIDMGGRIYDLQTLADQRIKALDNATALIHYLHLEIIRLRSQIGTQQTGDDLE